MEGFDGLEFSFLLDPPPPLPELIFDTSPPLSPPTLISTPPPSPPLPTSPPPFLLSSPPPSPPSFSSPTHFNLPAIPTPSLPSPPSFSSPPHFNLPAIPTPSLPSSPRLFPSSPSPSSPSSSFFDLPTSPHFDLPTNPSPAPPHSPLHDHLIFYHSPPLSPPNLLSTPPPPTLATSPLPFLLSSPPSSPPSILIQTSPPSFSSPPHFDLPSIPSPSLPSSPQLFLSSPSPYFPPPPLLDLPAASPPSSLSSPLHFDHSIISTLFLPSSPPPFIYSPSLYSPTSPFLLPNSPPSSLSSPHFDLPNVPSLPLPFSLHLDLPSLPPVSSSSPLSRQPPLLSRYPNSSSSKSSPLTEWTDEEKKQFDLAFKGCDFNRCDGLEFIASRMPGKSIEQIKERYQVKLKELGGSSSLYVQQDSYIGTYNVGVTTCANNCTGLPAYVNNVHQLYQYPVNYSAMPYCASIMPFNNYNPGNYANKNYPHSSWGESDQLTKERKKSESWTAEEHRLFLAGLQQYGKGNWKVIHKDYLKNKTSTQIASHAQKFFIRQKMNDRKNRRKSSILDIQTVDDDIEPTPEPPKKKREYRRIAPAPVQPSASTFQRQGGYNLDFQRPLKMRRRYIEPILQAGQPTMSMPPLYVPPPIMNNIGAGQPALSMPPHRIPPLNMNKNGDVLPGVNATALYPSSYE